MSCFCYLLDTNVLLNVYCSLFELALIGDVVF